MSGPAPQLSPASQSSGSTAAGTLAINLKAFTDNYGILCGQVSPNTIVSSVVKANAYGLGVEEMAPALFAKGCRIFFVATTQEALCLRALLPQAEIFILCALIDKAGEEYIHHNIHPVLNSLHDLALWRHLARKHNRTLAAALHIDTGMNRLGLEEAEVQTLMQDAALLSGLDIQLVMSHLISADESGSPLNQQQCDKFKSFISYFPNARKSLANSSGIFRGTDYHFDMVRPGMALYGLNPTPETKNPMNPVVTLEARILQIRHVKAKETIGYNATYSFKGPSLTATVGLGYADGFCRVHSNKSFLYWQGIACPVVGRVSMDLVTVDLSHLRGMLPQTGDYLEVIGPHQSADELAQSAGTIGYEILTSLGQRYHRIYRAAT